jgi:hypothetical protein
MTFTRRDSSLLLPRGPIGWLQGVHSDLQQAINNSPHRMLKAFANFPYWGIVEEELARTYSRIRAYRDAERRLGLLMSRTTPRRPSPYVTGVFPEGPIGSLQTLQNVFYAAMRGQELGGFLDISEHWRELERWVELGIPRRNRREEGS